MRNDSRMLDLAKQTLDRYGCRDNNLNTRYHPQLDSLHSTEEAPWLMKMKIERLFESLVKQRKSTKKKKKKMKKTKDCHYFDPFFDVCCFYSTLLKRFLDLFHKAEARSGYKESL